jgi:hypothetical protein
MTILLHQKLEKLTHTFVNNNYYCQHTLQAIWGFGLMEKLVCIWMIWQIRIMGLI